MNWDARHPKCGIIMGYMVPGALLIVDHSTWKTSRHVAEHGGTFQLLSLAVNVTFLVA